MGPVSALFLFMPDGPWTKLGWFSVCWRRFFPVHHVPYGLPIQAPQSQLHDQDLPSQHQCQWFYLSWHPERPMVSCIDHREGSVFFNINFLAHCIHSSFTINLFNADWSQSRWSTGPRYRSSVQDRSFSLRGNSSRVDKEVSTWSDFIMVDWLIVV